MPRAILGQLSPNHIRNYEYSFYIRAILYEMHRNKAISAVIANNENIFNSTVRIIFKNITIITPYLYIDLKDLKILTITNVVGLYV
jgi:hypothetical protein